MPEVEVVFDRDSQGIPSKAEVKIGRKKLGIQWTYSPTKRVYRLKLKGKRGVLPSFAETVAVVDAMRASEMGIFHEKGEVTEFFKRSGTLKANAIEILCDLPNLDVELQHLEFASNSKSTRLLIATYDSSGAKGTSLTVLLKNASDQTYLSAENVNNQESILFYELIYDTTNNWYKFGLGYPLRFCNGLYVAVQGTATDQNVACHAIVMIRG